MFVSKEYVREEIGYKAQEERVYYNAKIARLSDTIHTLFKELIALKKEHNLLKEYLQVQVVQHEAKTTIEDL